MALDDYKSTNDTHYGKIGPCLKPGHPKEHTLDEKCLQAMRQFLYPNKTFGQFIQAVKNK